MSSRYGMRYSWYAGLPPDSGRYRFTRNTTSRPAMSILPLDGLPLRDLHRRVIDSGHAIRPVRERVLQVIHVVARREVRPAVGATRLPSVQGAVRDGRRDIEHEVELEDAGHLRVEDAVLVRQPDTPEAVPQLGEFSARVGEAGFVPEDADVALHELLHLDPHAGQGLLPPLPAHQAVEDAGFLLPERFARGRSPGIRDPLLRAKQRVAYPRGTAAREALRKEETCIFDGLMGRERGKETLAGVRVEMQQLMERDVGIFRDEAGLSDACGKLAKLRDRFGSVGLADKDRVFNTEMTGVLELDFMLDVAASIANSALNRRESRGAHSRTDFPARDDVNYLNQTLAYRTDGMPRVDYSPVKITKWQPVERKY